MSNNWQDQGNCKNVPTELFYKTRGEIPTAVERACGACPVRLECLEHAIVTNEQFGIWGGVNMFNEGARLRVEYRNRLTQIKFVKCGHPKISSNIGRYGQCVTCRVEAVKNYNARKKADAPLMRERAGTR